jgi:undecaprenyl-diphosphatase
MLLVGAYLFLELTIRVYHREVFPFDASILGFFAEKRSPALDVYFRWATWAGSRYLLVPLTVLGIAALIRYRYHGAALLLGLGFTGATLFTMAIKAVLARERPALFPSLMALPADLSFPSSHVTQITAFALATFLILRHTKPRWQWPAGGVLAILVVSVAVSRLYLQVHYPSDILGGLLAGYIWVFVVHSFVNHRWCMTSGRRA